MPRPLPLVLAVLALAGACARADDARNFALLVGVQNYDGTALSNLHYCENDAHALARLLEARPEYRGRVTVLTEKAVRDGGHFNLLPTADNVRRHLRALVSEPALGERSTVFVAFSGHGVHLKKDNALHFCPSGADLDKPETLLPLAEVYDQLERCKAGVRLLFVDACRNDPLEGKAAGDARLEGVTRPLVPDPPGGIAAFFSCSTGEKSRESHKLKHGVFSHFVIEGLGGAAADQTGRVTVPDLEKYLVREVPEYIRQGLKDRLVRQTPERKGALRGEVELARRAFTALPVADGVTMEFVPVRPGGSAVTRPFLIGRTEVTVRQYRAVPDPLWSDPPFRQGDDHPAVNVSRQAAAVYCEALALRLGRRCRLPSEAEWEHAARAGAAGDTFTGAPLTAADAHFSPDGGPARAGTRPAGGGRANALGLFGVAGNAWEWCDGGAARGGAYDSDADDCRLGSRRVVADKLFRSPGIGFRVLVELP